MVKESEIFKQALLSQLNGSSNVPFDAVESALSSLDRPTQALLRMRYMRSMTDRQIGLMLAQPESFVEDRIANALDRIKRIIKK